MTDAAQNSTQNNQASELSHQTRQQNKTCHKTHPLVNHNTHHQHLHLQHCCCNWIVLSNINIAWSVSTMSNCLKQFKVRNPWKRTCQHKYLLYKLKFIRGYIKEQNNFCISNCVQLRCVWSKSSLYVWNACRAFQDRWTVKAVFSS